MIIIALPQAGFDPTECVAPWLVLSQAGYDVCFATPNGKPSIADSRMITKGFGPLSPLLMTHPYILKEYHKMVETERYKNPTPYDKLNVDNYRGMVIPGGHGAEMQDMLHSKALQKVIADFFKKNKPIGALCTGVLALARSKQLDNPKRSVLYGKKTTAVTKLMELAGWGVTYPWLKNYFKPNKDTVQDEIIQNLQNKDDFLTGPFPIYPMRYSSKAWNRQFVVRDGNYISARWPGDAYRFSCEFLSMLQENEGS